MTLVEGQRCREFVYAVAACTLSLVGELNSFDSQWQLPIILE